MLYNICMGTKLKYFDDSYLFEYEAIVQEIFKDEKGNDVIVLNETIFYPQGGGQPYDQGYIKNNNNQFKVNEVRFIDGKVNHIGLFESGVIKIGDKVVLSIDKSRREYNSRNHTAGHLIDIAIKKIGSFTPVKGFHFPEGAYVEYQGVIDETQKEEIRNRIEEEVNKLINENINVVTKFVSHQELFELCDFVPEWIPKDKPIRVVKIGDYKAHPCGGTHIKNTKEIGKMIIEKISQKKGNTRISYKINQS
jgi:Ser-tRNA(Ala) deacylase AlaX